MPLLIHVEKQCTWIGLPVSCVLMYLRNFRRCRPPFIPLTVIAYNELASSPSTVASCLSENAEADFSDLGL